MQHLKGANDALSIEKLHEIIQLNILSDKDYLRMASVLYVESTLADMQ